MFGCPGAARRPGTAQDIKAKIAESAETQEHIEQHRDAYRAIASRASAIFFCIYSLRGADPMYQFSLTWFKHLFDSAIVNTNRSDDQAERIKTINDFFTSSLYVPAVEPAHSVGRGALSAYPRWLTG